jgi:hypothetical protein
MLPPLSPYVVKSSIIPMSFGTCIQVIHKKSPIIIPNWLIKLRKRLAE